MGTGSEGHRSGHRRDLLLGTSLLLRPVRVDFVQFPNEELERYAEPVGPHLLNVLF